MALDKNYDSKSTESRLYPAWEESGAFACNPSSSADPYCIMIPPPNVTGSLHMGHGLTFTIQDTLIRYNRMKGKDVLWQPGTDHAGIATQMVVERELAKEGLDRREMGREKFLDRVWEWKEQSGGTITKQLRHLGASMDWPRERFTMDEGLAKAVTKAFVEMYREGLIYKDKRLVNWDPKMLSAISDLEVESKDVNGHLWHLKYPVEGTDEFIIVATTRPETMLGDTAVAVHPENENFQHLIGKQVRLPLVDRLIPIVGDEHADPEKGSGAVKITPAHDYDDFAVGKRHDLPMINIFDKHAHLNDEVPEKYRGMERFEARDVIVADMEELGLLEKVDPHNHAVPHGDRSGIPVEPWLSEQWYCDATKLAIPAIEAVESGKTKFVPEQWTNTYYAWMRNIQPWCISRQLWWGHQIPAWYAEDGEVFVANDEEEAMAMAKEKYGHEVTLTRDEDVLDTWFSSGLWPFSTLGWPEQTPELERYYPTDVLVTGFDIIFFWVARMMMLGLHFMKDVPFRTVYIHALVRDAKGQKMSKTKGNVIDPLETIDQFGCDALRFTLDNLSTPGRDIRLDPARIEGNRNFATKLWNAARFCEMNECAFDPAFDPASVKNSVNQWIVSRTGEAADTIAAHLDEFRFDLASHSAYEFVWNVFCDWYLEFSKPLLQGEAAEETRATTAWALVQITKILHPFMPYITEELYGHFTGKAEGSKDMLITQSWPEIAQSEAGKTARAEIDWLVTAISALRTVRAELRVPVKAEIKLMVKGASAETKARLETHKPIFERMARIASIEESSEVPSGSAQAIVEEATFILPLADVIDIAEESARLSKEQDKWSKEVKKVEAKLANDNFTSKAPEAVIEEHKERLQNAKAMIEKIEAARKSLQG